MKYYIDRDTIAHTAICLSLTRPKSHEIEAALIAAKYLFDHHGSVPWEDNRRHIVLSPTGKETPLRRYEADVAAIAEACGQSMQFVKHLALGLDWDGNPVRVTPAYAAAHPA